MEANNDVFFFQTKNEEIEKLYVSNRWRRAGSRLEKFLHDSVQLFKVFIIVSTDTQIYDRSRFERDRETN